MARAPSSQRGGTRRDSWRALTRAVPGPVVPRTRSPRFRNAIALILVTILAVGGGRKGLEALRARRALRRLAEDDVRPDEVEAMAGFGRTGLIELFRLLGTAPRADVRDAAGRTLAELWARDQLIAEEEKAVVRRGYQVDWQARRRYPRALRRPFPIAARYGVPFLRESGPGIAPANLEWSHRVAGSDRAGLERFSPWAAGPGTVSFLLDPADFPTNGPHRLVLHARARTLGLTESWEIELPQIPFTFEFDDRLALESLAAPPDDARAEVMAERVVLAAPEPSEGSASFLNVSDEWALRDPPVLEVRAPLPCDLAHRVFLEFEDVPGELAAGTLVVAEPASSPPAPRQVALQEVRDLPAGAIDRPGERRLRVVLRPDLELAWADPAIRSVWPGTLATAWVPVRVIRT